MYIRNWYENQMENRVDHLETKYAILSVVSLSGIMAGIEKDKNIYKIAFMIADVVLIFDILFELIYNIKKRGKKRLR